MSKSIMGAFVFAVAAGTLAMAGEAAKPAAGATAYDITGKYYETCACTVSCPCPANVTLPTEGHCDAISLIRVDKGMVGKTKMDGLSIAVVLRSPQGAKVQDSFEKGEMDHFTLYLDAAATPEQKEAMNTLLPALFGTKEIKGSKPPQWSPMTLAANGDVVKYDIEGGKKLAFEIENIKVGDLKHASAKADNSNRIELTNAAPFPWVKGVTQGVSKKFHYDDLGVKWDYSQRNAFFGIVAAKGTYAPAPPEAPKQAMK